MRAYYTSIFIVIISLTTNVLAQTPKWRTHQPSRGNHNHRRDSQPKDNLTNTDQTNTNENGGPAQNLINFPGQEAKPECAVGEKLSQHDCNRALLALGPGIKGKIKFLRVDTDTATGVFGSCKVTVQSLDKRPVHVSKGRLEHGPGYVDFMKTCDGQAGTMILGGGQFGMTIESVECDGS